MRIWISGGGLISRYLAESAVREGHEVIVATRTTDRHAMLRQTGARVLACDVMDEAALATQVSRAGPDVVVNQLTALPERLNPRKIGRDLAATNQLRIEGTRNLMAAARAAGVRHVVAQSAAFAYAPGPQTPRTEDDPLYASAPGPFQGSVRAICDLERATLHTPGVIGVVLRYGYLYGPGTHFGRDGSIAADVRRRRFPIVGSGGGIFSFIHLGDAASATLAAIEATAQATYNVVDDDPAPVAAWLPVYARVLGAPAPRRVPGWLARGLAGSYGMYLMTAMPGASNARAKEDLGWTPLMTSWRRGWEEELARR